MIEIIGSWSHALGALLYGALAVWQLRQWNADYRSRPLVAAFAAMSAFAVMQTFFGSADFRSYLAESARNLAFLTFMYGMVRGSGEDGRQRAVKVVYSAVAAVVGVQIILAFLLPQLDGPQEPWPVWNSIGATVAAGSLILVNHLYTQADRNSRWGIRLPLLAVAGLWAYDLHLYTMAYLTRGAVGDLFALRGTVALMLVPLFAVATRRTAEWRVQLSRAAAFQSLSIVAVAGYFILMISVTRLLEAAGGEWVLPAQLTIIAAATLAAAALVPNGRLRARLRVAVAKHMFEHRYDYREDWLRFTRTVARAGEDGSPIQERVVRALAEIAGASGGLLLIIGDQRRLSVSAQWQWPHTHLSGEVSAELIRFLERSSYVLDFAAIGGGILTRKGLEVAIPGWFGQEGNAWAGVPLVHDDRLVGLVLLGHPTPRRPMDWEDYDLFRTAGIQAASYIAEARSQEALSHAQRFDEFNRRFAFIMHDIKNLVSQLTLVTRNAERHADNPEFRADMVATLQSSVKKMNDLLARLSGEAALEPQMLQSVNLRRFLSKIAEANGRNHPVVASGDAELAAIADPLRLEQAVAHLLQNAIDASHGEPVRIVYVHSGAEAAISILDSGDGMSAEFVRTRLFQPFASTKENGFGVGAFEARSLIAVMGGRIEVESRQGEGSRFTIYLPKAGAEQAPKPERMRA